MRLGILKIELYINGSNSLKEKRMVLRHLKDRIRRDFNVSISEIDNHDKWQRSTMAIAYVSNDKNHVDKVLNKVRDFFDKNRHVIVSDIKMEIL